MPLTILALRSIPILVIGMLACGQHSAGPVQINEVYRLSSYNGNPLPVRLTHPSEAVQKFHDFGQLTLLRDGTYQKIDRFITISEGVERLEELAESSTYVSTPDEIRLKLADCDLVTRLRVETTAGVLSGNALVCVGLDHERPVTYERIHDPSASSP